MFLYLVDIDHNLHTSAFHFPIFHCGSDKKTGNEKVDTKSVRFGGITIDANSIGFLPSYDC